MRKHGADSSVSPVDTKGSITTALSQNNHKRQSPQKTDTISKIDLVSVSVLIGAAIGKALSYASKTYPRSYAVKGGCPIERIRYYYRMAAESSVAV